MKTVYERLNALQIKLPEVPPPVVDGYVPLFVPFVRTGNLICLSGRLAKKDGKPFSGKLGQQITPAEGRQAARDVAIELVATLQAALGDLNNVKRVVNEGIREDPAPDRASRALLCRGGADRCAGSKRERKGKQYWIDQEPSFLASRTAPT
ncbi:MAG: RidA family protein [Acidobacteria bacterium]|nr:RidA family protein [Acidobacteriota bacterium]